MTRNLTGVSAKLWLIFIGKYREMRRNLPGNILRELCGYLSEWLYLPYLSEDGKKLCVLQVEGWTMTTKTMEIVKYSLCLVDAYTIFYIGSGGKSSNLPYLMNLRNYTKTALENAEYIHKYPGVACLYDHIYVFSGQIKACEKYSLQQRRWSSIMSLNNAESQIPTCTHLNFVFLMPEKRNYMLSYDAFRNSYEQISLSFQYKGSFFCIGNSEFIGFNEYFAWKWRVNEDRAEIVCKADGVMLMFHDWRRTGGRVSAVAQSQTCVERDRRVYVLLSSFPQGGIDKVLAVDSVNRHIEVKHNYR